MAFEFDLTPEELEDVNLTVTEDQADTGYAVSTATEAGAIGTAWGATNNVGDGPEIANTVRNDLVTTGRSDAISAMLQAEEQKEDTDNASFIVERRDSIDNVHAEFAALKSQNDPDPVATSLESINLTRELPDPYNENKVTLTVPRNKDVYQQVNSLVVDAMEARIPENDVVAAAKLTFDLSKQMIPINVGYTYWKIYDDVFPEEDISIGRVFTPGELVSKMKEKLRETDPARLPVLAEELMTAIRTHTASGWMGGNDALMLDLSEQIFKEVQFGRVEPESFDYDRLFLNIGGVFDAISLGALGRTSTKVINRFTEQSVANRVAKANPDLSEQMLARGAGNIEAAAELGTNPTQIVEASMLPTIRNLDPQSVPASVVETIVRLNRQTEDILELAQDTSVNFSSAEKTSAFRFKETIFERLRNKEGPHFDSSRSAGILDSTGYNVKARYSYDGKYGWNTPKQAIDALREQYPTDKITLYSRNAKGNYEKYDGFIDDKNIGDFVADVDMKYAYNTKHADIDKLNFGQNAVTTSGLKADWRADPDSRFASWVAGIGARSTDKANAIKASMTRTLKPFVKLDDKGRWNVMRLLRELSETESDLRMDEMIQRGLTDSEISGALAVRATNDIAFLTMNNELRRVLDTKGMKDILSNGYELRGRPIDMDTSIQYAFDPQQHKIVKLSPEDIEKLYSNDGQMAKLFTDYEQDGRIVSHTLIDRSRGATLSDLPPTVMKYNPGYFSRFYEDNWFVEIERGVMRNAPDGSAADDKIVNVVANTGGKADAEKIAAQLAKDDPSIKVRVRPDREVMSSDESLQSHYEVLTNQGAILTGKRGERLHGVHEGAAKIADPLTSMNRMISIASHRIAKGDAVAGMKVRFLNDYGDLLPKIEGETVFPTSAGQIARRDLGKRHDEAVELWNYIRTLDGTPSKEEEAWKLASAKLAETIDGDGHSAFRRYMGEKVRLAGDKDIFSRVKGLNFNLLIVPNVMRQLLLQSQQFMFVAPLDPKYVVSKLPAEQLLLNTGLMVADRPEALKLAQKGMSKKSFNEMQDLVKAFRASGFDQSIDSHSFAADGLVEFSKRMGLDPALNPHKASIARVGRALGDVAKVPVIMARKIGFDAGEHLNMSSTWLMAKNKFIKNNPGKDWRKFNEQISTEARQLSLTMTPPGKFGYQRGWASLATQFLSIQHKGLLAMMGKNTTFKKAGESYWKSDAARVAASQLALFGTAGWGISALVQETADHLGIQMSPEVNDAISGGITELMVNESMQAFNGDDSRVSVSNSLAPASGIFTTTFDMLQMFGTEPGAELFLGPTASVAGRFKDTFDNARTIFYLNGVEDDLDSLKKLTTKQVENLLTMTSQYNNYAQMQFANRTGYFVSKSGNPTVRATMGEATAKMLFGFSSKEQEAYFRLTEMAHSQPAKQETLDEIADTYVRRIEGLLGKLVDEQPESLDDLYYKRLETANVFINRLEEETFADKFLIGSLPEADRTFVQLAISKKIAEKLESGQDKLIRNLTDYSLRGYHGKSTDYVITKLINSGLVDENQVETEIKPLLDYITSNVTQNLEE
jgi:hypothetical protein